MQAHGYIAGGRLAREEWLTVALEARVSDPERATILEALHLRWSGSRGRSPTAP
jgi:hypothetical protein